MIPLIQRVEGLAIYFLVDFFFTKKEDLKLEQELRKSAKSFGGRKHRIMEWSDENIGFRFNDKEQAQKFIKSCKRNLKGIKEIWFFGCDYLNYQTFNKNYKIK